MPDSMIEWAAVAAKLARQAAGKKQVHVAAELSVDQTTIARFERGNWPVDADRVLDAYARVCGIDGGAIVLWATAAELWARHRHEADDDAVPDLEQFERELAAVSRRLRREGRSSEAGHRGR